MPGIGHGPAASFPHECGYSARVDNDTLRVALAAVLGPLFWGLMRYLWGLLPGARRRAAREARRREESAERAALRGRQLAHWLRRCLGRLKRG